MAIETFAFHGVVDFFNNQFSVVVHLTVFYFYHCSLTILVLIVTDKAKPVFHPNIINFTESLKNISDVRFFEVIRKIFHKQFAPSIDLVNRVRAASDLMPSMPAISALHGSPLLLLLPLLGVTAIRLSHCQFLPVESLSVQIDRAHRVVVILEAPKTKP